MADTVLESTLLTDEDLVRRIVEGEQSLFEVVVQRYSRRLYRIVISVLRSETEAEDVVQDAFVSAYQHLAQFAGRAKFSTWLSRIALHRAFAVASQRGRCVSLDEEYEDATPVRVVPDDAPTPEERLYFNEVTALLCQAVDDLPDSYRSVLLLREVDEVDTSQAARLLRISESNVKVRLHRARAMVRDRYERALQSGISPSVPALTAITVLAS